MTSSFVTGRLSEMAFAAFDVFLGDKKCQGARHYHGQSNENLSFSVMLALVTYSNW